ncbi:SSU rRNA (adenine(1518)-N(6)/adenine(1519)-N(6))-dimethyltransferase [invertebrate metagenome]|uniref:SSU rRNA (Adenine(1518)-N(6)/adenine(1519)-N(6))-dimethyltransferase n=1 Tax=invertebrate metagenome TaxID=1711999 RepID=A0A484H714_9ZZZZ
MKDRGYVSPVVLSASPLPPVRDVIARYGLTTRKALSQHFLLDQNLTRRIVRAAGDLKTGTVIEIGSGPGSLTRALLAGGVRQVVAVERDSRCLPALAEVATAWPGQLIVLEADAMTVNLAQIGEAPRHIVANLPYHVATSLLLRWLRNIRAITSMTLMFQKEVADRLGATPRGKHYGRLSVITQWLCVVRPLFDLPPQAFTPPPHVTSTVVHLRPRPEPLAPASWPALEAVTAAAFGQRRKMLRQSLKSLGQAERLCASAHLAPTARAEEIDVAGFCALARAMLDE